MTKTQWAFGLAGAASLCVSSALANDIQHMARKNNPVIRDDSDQFKFPSLVRRDSDVMRLGFGVGGAKTVTQDAAGNGFGGMNLEWDDETTYGLWINRGTTGTAAAPANAGGSMLLGSSTGSGIGLTRLLDISKATGSDVASKGMSLKVDALDTAGKDGYGLGVEFILGTTEGNADQGTSQSDRAFGGGLAYGKPGKDANAALTGKYLSRTTTTGGRFNTVMGYEVQGGVQLKPETGFGLMLPVYWGPEFTRNGFHVGAYGAGGLSVLKQGVKDSKTDFGLMLPSFGMSVDWALFDWWTFRSGIAKSWFWTVSQKAKRAYGESPAGTVDGLGNPAHPYTIDAAFLNGAGGYGASGWNIGTTLARGGVSIDFILSIASMTGGPTTFSGTLWGGLVEGYAMLNWDFGEGDVAAPVPAAPIVVPAPVADPAVPTVTEPQSQRNQVPTTTPVFYNSEI